MNSVITILGILIQIHSSFCTNYLFLNGVASHSHHIWNRVLMERIAADKNNNLTILSPDIDKKTLPNMHYIQLEKTYEHLAETLTDNFIDRSTESTLKNSGSVYQFYIINCQGMLMSKGVDTIMNYPDDFKIDIVVYDFTMGPCLLPLLHKFKYPPLVSVSAFNNPPYTVALVGGEKYPAFVPFYAINYGIEMNFFERFYNSILYALDRFYRNYIFMPQLNQVVNSKFKYQNMPLLEELERMTAIMLLNYDISVDFPEPLQPNVIQVGGLQIIDPRPLPNDLKEFIENGKKGTVLMSLGTNMRSEYLSKETLINILSTFKELSDYNFVWKFEADTLPIEKPKNVKIAKFLPQNDILAHPNLKAFITHSGHLSTQEALWYGKPMVGMPVFVDQHRNLGRTVRFGVAERIYFQTLTKKEFKTVLSKVLEDPKYTEKAQLISKRFRDKPERPLERAVWWIEYVLRNPNPEHLQSPTVKINSTFISNSYDVIAFSICILGFAIFIIYKFFAFLFCRSNYISKIKKNN